VFGGTYVFIRDGLNESIIKNLFKFSRYTGTFEEYKLDLQAQLNDLKGECRKLELKYLQNEHEVVIGLSSYDKETGETEDDLIKRIENLLMLLGIYGDVEYIEESYYSDVTPKKNVNY